MSLSVSAAVCFIACHGGPADHFATFAKNLEHDGHHVEILASGPALNKFLEKSVYVNHQFSIDKLSEDEKDLLAVQIAKTCSTASVVITDVGDPFAYRVQQALAKYAVEVLRLAYYDNPEPYVPGGYSTQAAKVILAAQGILFGNANLAKAPLYQEPNTEVDFGDRKRIGLGYYPVNQGADLAVRREKEHAPMRAKLFCKHNIEDNGQKVLLYLGGNNEEYFNEAFPAFLSILDKTTHQSDLSNLVIVMQQHPGAKSANRDANLLAAKIKDFSHTSKAPKIIMSDVRSDEALVCVDAALYYQTSMGPQIALAGIPTVQIGHKTYADILVRNHITPSVTNAPELIHVINALKHDKKTKPQQEVIHAALGIKSDWLKKLEAVIRTATLVSKQ